MCKLNIPDQVLNLLGRGANYTPHAHPAINALVGSMELSFMKLGNIFEQNIGIKGRVPVYEQSLIRKLKLDVLKWIKLGNFDSMITITKFISNNDLIVKKADKNLGLTLMPFEWYNDNVMMEISNDKFYKRVGGVIPSIVKTRVIDSIMKWEKHLDKQDLNYLTKSNDKVKIPNFYGIPKLHKDPIKLRPIISSINWVTTDLAKWLDIKLQPLLQQVTWVVPNSMEIVNRLEQFPNIHYNRDVKLVTADVISLYTRINLDEAYGVLYEFFVSYELFECTPSSARMIVDLTKSVMENNYFMYGKNYYKQICGTAMGCNMAPVFANLFVAAYEWKFIAKQPIEQPNVYFRYLDDVFFVWANSNDLATFKIYMNTWSTSLEFTFNEGDEVNFLDLTIIKGNDGFEFRNYTKPNNPNLYTDPRTYNEHHVVYNWIQGECIRLCRNSSSETDFVKSIGTFKRALYRRGYPLRIVANQVKKICYADRDGYLTPKNNLKIDLTGAPNGLTNIIVINNDPGRHLVKKCIRNYIQFLAAYHHEHTIPKILIVVRKGKTLMDYVNISVKRVLARRT